MPQDLPNQITPSTGSSKVFDIAKPGDFTPSKATSRPVIVSNRPVMRDPMVMAPGESLAMAASPGINTVPASKVKLEPLPGSAIEAAPVPSDEPAETTAASVASAAEADMKLQTELADLTDKKHYFLPVNSVEKRRSRLTTGFGLLLIIILGLALINFMLDAGFIHIEGVKPLTHFFSNQ